MSEHKIKVNSWHVHAGIASLRFFPLNFIDLRTGWNHRRYWSGWSRNSRWTQGDLFRNALRYVANSLWELILFDRNNLSPSNWLLWKIGAISDVLINGKINGIECVLLGRHGRKHSIMPSNINYRANVWALKNVGCTHIIATTATGSLQEHIKPGDIVILDNFIDRTTKRNQTFYDGKELSPFGVCHLPMEPAFCEKTRDVIIQTACDLGLLCLAVFEVLWWLISIVVCPQVFQCTIEAPLSPSKDPDSPARPKVLCSSNGEAISSIWRHCPRWC